ncbi:UDP-glucose 4-epimerase GalE [Polynucleobacter paneuropaeus]|nr:UDP-glucose 4-epimerase GalE [Polynucleobacter paneuropaeus]MBT8544375.1 UDP-glucose 4-epimerase GalE [Polynucleobacter paneuropaeus]MBT8555563.1 UDP-glucose 4-epimerase GalE [Polynucleobacter paneuropaeus]MBT8560839.1 UDP-glucose 4-epimerase GalE [Polynucleobacter paneuropaeus]
MKILLTGGAGYIGSHTAVSLSEAGHEVVLLDNFCNSHKSILKRLKNILGVDLPCIEGDVRNTALVLKALQDCKIESVIHFAGLKAVGESVQKPIEYYATNIQGAISILEAMQLAQVKRLIFSSSATVYGYPQYFPIDEHHPTGATNPYGTSKLHIEEMLRDVTKSDPAWKIISLRYFNPVGAHDSGLIGEDPNGIPNNLTPYISQVAAGKLPILNIYGNDYETKDGTGVRDYIHVMDLADGHLAALNHLKLNSGYKVFNLGTGKGYSVLEMLHSFEVATGKKIPYQVIDRRPGDIATCFSSAEKAKKDLNWSAKRGLAEMSASSWKWQEYSKDLEV